MRKYLLSLIFLIVVSSGAFAQSNFNSFSPGLEIKAFPNPATSHVTIELKNIDQNEKYTLAIYNVLGRELKRYSMDTASGNSFKADISFLKKGIYLYRVINSKGKNLATKRLMVAPH